MRCCWFIVVQGKCDPPTWPVFDQQKAEGDSAFAPPVRPVSGTVPPIRAARTAAGDEQCRADFHHAADALPSEKVAVVVVRRCGFCMAILRKFRSDSLLSGLYSDIAGDV